MQCYDDSIPEIIMIKRYAICHADRRIPYILSNGQKFLTIAFRLYLILLPQTAYIRIHNDYFTQEGLHI